MRALVTGGAIRLGREMALYLAEQGYDVAVHYAKSDEAALQTCAEITALGRKSVALQADLLSDTGSQPLVARAAEALRRSVDRLGQQCLNL